MANNEGLVLLLLGPLVGVLLSLDLWKIDQELRLPIRSFIEVNDQASNPQLVIDDSDAESPYIIKPNTIDGIEIHLYPINKKPYITNEYKKISTYRYPHRASDNRKKEVEERALLEGKLESLERTYFLAKHENAKAIASECMIEGNSVTCKSYIYK